MFELKYKITDADMTAVNKRIMRSYFIPYLTVSLVGLAAGITATVLRPRTDLLVLGIILIVLGALLLGCTALLAIAPKTFAVSALATSDELERTVKISDGGIAVDTDGQSETEFRYGEISCVKNRKNYLLCYVEKDAVVLIKDAVVCGGSLEDLYLFLKAKIDGAPVQRAARSDAPTDTSGAATGTAEENTDGEAGAVAEETSAVDIDKNDVN